jgi:hypothetical protein
MRKWTLATAAAALLIGVTGASAQSPSATPAGNHICLWTQDIDHTHVVNPQTILFYTRDGHVWQNDLKGPCPGLQFHGFTYATRSMQICGPEIGIRVLHSGEACVLGEFRPSSAPFHY